MMKFFVRNNFCLSMVFFYVIVLFYVFFNVFGFFGNFLVIVVIVLERRFYLMWYFLFVSFVVLDMLCLILVNLFCIVSIVKERWLYG